MSKSTGLLSKLWRPGACATFLAAAAFIIGACDMSNSPSSGLKDGVFLPTDLTHQAWIFYQDGGLVKFGACPATMPKLDRGCLNGPGAVRMIGSMPRDLYEQELKRILPLMRVQSSDSAPFNQDLANQIKGQIDRLTKALAAPDISISDKAAIEQQLVVLRDKYAKEMEKNTTDHEDAFVAEFMSSLTPEKPYICDELLSRCKGLVQPFYSPEIRASNGQVWRASILEVIAESGVKVTANGFSFTSVGQPVLVPGPHSPVAGLLALWQVNASRGPSKASYRIDGVLGRKQALNIVFQEPRILTIPSPDSSFDSNENKRRIAEEEARKYSEQRRCLDDCFDTESRQRRNCTGGAFSAERYSCEDSAKQIYQSCTRGCYRGAGM